MPFIYSICFSGSSPSIQLSDSSLDGIAGACSRFKTLLAMSISDSSLDIISKDFMNLQLFESGIKLFENNPLYNDLHKLLFRVLAAPTVVTLFEILARDKNFKKEAEMECGQNLDAAKLISLVKFLPISLAVKAQAVVEAIEMERFDSFVAAFSALAKESGLTLKMLDENLEESLLHSYRKDLVSQVSSEADPIQLLPQVISLLYLQVYNKAIPAPVESLSALISQIKDKLPEETIKVLVDYQRAAATLLALQSAATDDEEDCTADRLLTKKEYLEDKMANLKDLVLKA